MTFDVAICKELGPSYIKYMCILNAHSIWRSHYYVRKSFLQKCLKWQYILQFMQFKLSARKSCYFTRIYFYQDFEVEIELWNMHLNMHINKIIKRNKNDLYKFPIFISKHRVWCILWKANTYNILIYYSQLYTSTERYFQSNSILPSFSRLPFFKVIPNRILEFTNYAHIHNCI